MSHHSQDPPPSLGPGVDSTLKQSDYDDESDEWSDQDPLVGGTLIPADMK